MNVSEFNQKLANHNLINSMSSYHQNWIRTQIENKKEINLILHLATIYNLPEDFCILLSDYNTYLNVGDDFIITKKYTF